MPGYLETCKDRECFGCEACVQICPQKCIELETRANGFWYPVIDKARCTDCGLCREVCPYGCEDKMLAPSEKQVVYAARSFDERIRGASTSGGIFTELALPVLAEGGVVFGVVYSGDCGALHSCAETVKQLVPMRGSKYVESRIRETYKQTRDLLAAGRWVLFSGTPCQIAGLRQFLRDEPRRLLTVDLICHGVVAPSVAAYHVKCLEQQYGSKAVHVRFRDKRRGWKTSMAFGVDFESGDVYWGQGKQDRFFNMFLSNYDLRECCYSCPFTKVERVSDITLGDFWGIERSKPALFDNKGHSVVMVNTDKGRSWFAKALPRLQYEEASLTETTQPKLHHPTEPDIWRGRYLRSVDNRGLERTVELFSLPRPLWKKGVRYFQRKLRSVFSGRGGRGRHW